MVCAGKRKCSVNTRHQTSNTWKAVEVGEAIACWWWSLTVGRLQPSTSRTRTKLYIAFISTLEIPSGTKRRKTLKRKAHQDVEMPTYLWFLQNLAEWLLSQDRSLLRRHFNSIAGFMARSLQTISRLVKGGYSIKWMEQMPEASAFTVKSLQGHRVLPCF